MLETCGERQTFQRQPEENGQIHDQKQVSWNLISKRIGEKSWYC
jgi:hypothetical protein